VAWNALSNDAMELRMVTIEILGVTVHTRPLGQWREVGVVRATLSLGERVPFLQLRCSDRCCLCGRERCDHVTVRRRRQRLVSCNRSRVVTLGIWFSAALPGESDRSV